MTPAEFFSVACGHCARWGTSNHGRHHSVVKKENYICTSTGRIMLNQHLSCTNYGKNAAACTFAYKNLK